MGLEKLLPKEIPAVIIGAIGVYRSVDSYLTDQTINDSDLLLVGLATIYEIIMSAQRETCGGKGSRIIYWAKGMKEYAFILGGVAALTVPFWHIDAAINKPKMTQFKMNVIKNCVDQFYKQEKRLPESIEELTNTRMIRIRIATLSDSWNNPILYTHNNHDTIFELRSAGRDRTMNSQDDLVLTATVP